MRLRSKKKTLAIITSITMVSYYVPPVLALNNEKSEFSSVDSLTCGYNQIYDDGLSSSWAPVKPNSPKSSQLEINFEAKNKGEEYNFKLIDSLSKNTIANINGVSNNAGTNTISLEVPGGTKSGKYNLVGSVGGREEVYKNIIVKNNLALDAKITSSENNNSLSKINDLTIYNYTSKGGSSTKTQVTLNPAVDMNFKFATDSVVDSIDIYSNNVENQGPLEFKISYIDINGVEQELGTFNNLNWEGYIDNSIGQKRKRATIKLENPIVTNELKISLTKTYQDWGNKYVIDEIMIWGYENVDENNISSNLKAYSGNTELTNLFDGNYSTSSNVSSLKICNNKLANDKVFSLKSVKIYANRNSINTAELLIATHARKDIEFASIKNLNSLVWKKDNKGDYIEISVDENFLSHAYELKFDRSVDIKEIYVTGTYFEENLLKDAKVTYNGEVINGYKMFDNVINSELILNGQKAQGTKEMELSFEDGNIYELSQLFLTANYPESQGIKSIQVSYIKDGKWVELEKVVAKYLSGQKEKRQSFVVDLPNIKTTKLKLKLEFNTTWSKGIITELNAVGRKYESGKAIASLIDHVDDINSSTKKLSLQWLEEVDKDYASKYTISLASSSNEDIIDLDGNINHTNNDENVTISYNVIDSENNKFKTGDIEVTVPKSLGGNLSEADLKIDKTTAYKNPAMGWVAYIEGFECTRHEHNGDDGLCIQIDDGDDAREYWRQIDELIEKGMPINILYIRQPWSWFEPTEGNYIWNDPQSSLSVLVEGARKRGIELAFRVLTGSSACNQQATPQYVFDAGATGVTRNYGNLKGVKDPHLNNSIFQEKFKKFVNAFGKEFNREDTAFIDAHGHGEWGEMNANVDISSGGNLNDTVDKLAQFYVNAFPDVLLGGQLGSSGGRDAINNSFKVDGKNFVIRRDAFGSPRWLPGDEPKINEVRNNGVPLFAENCYHHFDSRDFRWSSVIDQAGGGPNEYGGDDPYITIDAMMNGVVDDAIRLRANTIDLRVLEDCKLWVSEGRKYLDRFTNEGGYRISITKATYTNSVKAGQTINIKSVWQNNGVGILPNKNKRWNNKMKVAYALIDSNNNIVQKQIISTDEINAGDFEKGQDYCYESQFNVNNNIGAGTYRLAVSILNEKDNYNPGVQLANKGEVTNVGWLTLGSVSVK